MTHRKAAGLLPWYANATLGEDERRAVRKHLEECRECAGELAQLHAIQEAAAAGPAPAPSPDMFRRALARVEQYEAERESHPEAGAAGKTRRAWPAWLAGWWQFTPAFTRVVVAAQCVLILGLVGLILNRGGFTTLSGGSQGAGNGVRIAVAFQPGVTEETLRHTLQGIKGTIMAGPSALGLYTVQVPIGADQTGDVERLLNQLRQNRQVIRFAGRQP